MSDTFIFDWVARTRQGMLKYLDRITDEHKTTIPAEFNNNVYWQFGHVVTVADSIVYGFSGKERKLPQEFMTFFAPGTKPADWHGEPPAWEEILRVFNTQVEEFRSELGNEMDKPVAVADNFAGAKINHDLFELILSHEAAHSGMVNAMTRILKRA